MSGMDELRPLTAGRLLAIRRTVRAAGGDALEEAALCNARVLAESCFRDGEPAFADAEAVLAALTFPEMETLLERLAGQKTRAAAPAAVNPAFDGGRYERLRGGADALH